MRPTVLRLTDWSTGVWGAMRLHDPSDLECPLGQVLDGRFAVWDGSDRSVEVLEEHGPSLRCLQDLVCRIGPDGRLGRIWAGVGFYDVDDLVDLSAPMAPQLAEADGREFDLCDLVVDRSGEGYGRDWDLFWRRRRELVGGVAEAFVSRAVHEFCGEDSDDVMGLCSRRSGEQFLEALARAVGARDFESYSRFDFGGQYFRTGDQTVLNLAAGLGGVCVEKVQAMKFLTDGWGLESEYVLAGPWSLGPVPEDRLREIIATLDFRFAKRHMRYWQHLALLYWLDGEPMLVDCSGGWAPVMVWKGDDARRVLGGAPVRLRVGGELEDYYYHRVSQDIPLGLMLALECRLEYPEMVQVFSNELGLYLSGSHYVMPLLYRTSAEFEKLSAEYRAYSAERGLGCEVSWDWSFDGPIGDRFCESRPDVVEAVLRGRDDFMERVWWWQRELYGCGLVVMDLEAGV